jgi:hypothetical protein
MVGEHDLLVACARQIRVVFAAHVVSQQAPVDVRDIYGTPTHRRQGRNRRGAESIVTCKRLSFKELAEREGFGPGRFSNCLVAKGMAKTLVNTAILTQSHSHHSSQMSHGLTVFLLFWN